MNRHEHRPTGQRRVTTLLLAAALAAGGFAVVETANAPSSEAAVCSASWSTGNGYARSTNLCGYTKAEVGRTLSNGRPYVVSQTRYRSTAYVWSYIGKHNYASTWRW